MNGFTLQDRTTNLNNRASRRFRSPRAFSNSANTAGRFQGMRPLLTLSLLSCALLTGSLLTTVRAEDAPNQDKKAPTVPETSRKSNEEKEKKAKGKEDKPSIAIARAQDTPKQDTTPPANTQGNATAPAKPAETPPAAPAPASPEPGAVTITGLLDIYYGVNARAPRAANGGPFTAIATPSGETINSDNFGEFFNINDREPSFSLGEINISRTEGKGFPLGVTATLTFGDSARLYHATEPGGTSSWQTLHNLYVSKSYPFFGRTASVDFGKWATPIGLEVLESSNNDNYSRAFNFWYGVPFYHAGLRTTVPITPKLTAQVAVVNGWNNVADDNNAKTVYGLLTLKPNPRVTANFSVIGGAEGTGAFGPAVPKNQGSITTTLFDTNATWQVTPELKLTGWASLGNAAGGVNGTRTSGNWLGLVAGARYQFRPALAAAFRLEQFEDFPGVGGASPRFGNPGYLKMREATLTLEYVAVRNHLVTRLEYRHDFSNVAVFGAGTGGTTKDQDTVYLSEVLRF